ncbi:MAG: enoyl-CoA hydratase/isomerase family protein [Proteobacteria bacterium]|nr:enoyl-CoA hydratase/isomerase family protein [Pseudomonadota bacterium]
MIETRDAGTLRTITLARPPVNALNAELLEALGEAVARAPSEGVQGLVLTGAGKLFSAGLDVALLASLDGPGLRRFLGTFFGCLTRLAESPIPIVAAINGHSPAGGAVLALYCDHRIMARGDFRIGLNEVQVGLLPGPLIYGVLKRAVSIRVANEMLTQGLLVPPEEALAVGFVDELAEPGEVELRARAWLERVLALPPVAYRTTRAMVRADLIRLMVEANGPHAETLLEAWSGPESRASLAALVAKLGRK